MSAEKIAQAFHETYERLAHRLEYGYRTREASAKPWADVPDTNKALMVATAADLMTQNVFADEHHTMGELYDHRRALTAALMAERADISWRSKAHHPDDTPMFDGGYFIVGIETPAGMITYHYKLTHWDDFSEAPELPHAPKWDGAEPGDTVIRLLAWARDEPVPLGI